MGTWEEICYAVFLRENCHKSNLNTGFSNINKLVRIFQKIGLLQNVLKIKYAFNLGIIIIIIIIT